MKLYFILLLFYIPIVMYSQSLYNHPELEWHTIETEHFQFHFYDDTEILAREAVGIMEFVYPLVTDLYQFKPSDKTHIIFTDTDDISNGLTYYYDNKIVIWASPLDIALRGSHKWLENVLTHEYVHIVSIQKAMKGGRTFPGLYFQMIGYENETHRNVLNGYPNSIVSYPLPGVAVPPWLAEGIAQYMYDNADWDNWDSHRDMILRDRVLNDNLLSFAEMNTFGKGGIGNESVYNTGYAFIKFIADKYGSNTLKEVMDDLSKPINYSIDRSIRRVTGVSGKELYAEFKKHISKEYQKSITAIDANINNVKILNNNGTSNFYPKWSNNGIRIAYISNKENDYFGQTDLFVYNLDTNTEIKIANGVQSAAVWSAEDSFIYYSKKPLLSTSKGYNYYDLFSYNFSTKRESRLTTSARVTSPVYIETTNSIAYIAMKDGRQDIYTYSLDEHKIKKIAEFSDKRILHNLEFDMTNNRLLFDYTLNHFRDIAYISLENFNYYDIKNLSDVDERDMCVIDRGLLYSDDNSGIFNLVISDSTGTNYITNVPGGAFMPDINSDGDIVFSLYQNGKYNIAVIDSVYSIEQSFNRHKESFQKPVNNSYNGNSEQYVDNFARMFVMPRLMIDYGTLKPGFYFYSSEILDKLELSGGVTVNTDKDVDFGFNLTFRKLYPTIYTNFMYSTRNTADQSDYSVYKVDDQLKFRFLLMRMGVQLPIYGTEPLEIYAQWQRYRAYIKENIDAVNLKSGYAYDYFSGIAAGIKYGFNNIKRTVDMNINPSKGYKIFANVSYEMNDFIDGLNLSDSGTLIEQFAPNNYISAHVHGSYYLTLLPSKRWTAAVTVNGAWISNDDVDPFFNYFGGGLDGIQGYPYYSFEGTNSLFSEFALRLPLMRLNHITLGWMTWQNSTIGVEYQFGDTWTDEFDLKQSIGLQFRLNGYSFYNYPTAIAFEIHRGLTNFEVETDDGFVRFGNENKYYFTLLFNF